MYPKLKDAQTFMLNCLYSQNGENHIPLLLTTNVDLDRLIQTDLKQYLSFVQEYLAEAFDFANYQPDPNISKILDIKRAKDEEFNAFVARVVDQCPIESLQHHINSRFIPIEVNAEFPSDLTGYQQIPSADAKILLNYFPASTIVEIIV